MNQIINMIIRQMTNQLVRRGINAGFDKAGQISQRNRMQQLPPDALDDYGNPIEPELMSQGHRQQRQSRLHGQQMKVMRRFK